MFEFLDIFIVIFAACLFVAFVAQPVQPRKKKIRLEDIE